MRRTPTAFALASVLLLSGACGDEGVDEAVPRATAPPASGDAAKSTVAAPTQTSAPSTSAAPVVAGEFGDRIPLQVVNEAGRPGQLFGTTALAVSDRGVIAVASDDGGLTTFDAGGTSLADNAAAHDGREIVGLGFVDDRLVSVGEDGSALTWAEPDGDLTEPIATTSLAMGAVATAAIGNGWLAVGAVNGAVALFPTTDDAGLEAAAWQYRVTGRASVLAVAPGASRAAAPPAVAIATTEGKVLLYDEEQSGEPIEMPRPAGLATSLAFVDGGSTLLVGGGDVPLLVDVATGVQRSLDADLPPSGDPITAVAGWSAAGGASSRIASAGTDAPVGSADPSTTTATGGGAVVAVRLASTVGADVGRPTRGFQSPVSHMAFLPDASGLVIADGEHVVLQLIDD